MKPAKPDKKANKEGRRDKTLRMSPIVIDGRLAEFEAAAARVLADGRSLMGRERLHTLWQACLNVAHQDGAVAEIGVYRGGSAFFLADSLRRLRARDTPMHAIDTFEGHPADKLTASVEPAHVAGLFANTSFDEVQAYLAPFATTTVHKGEFSRVALSLPALSYSLVHIDVDTLVPTRECLNYFYPRMLRGGIIVLDDFGASKCPGVALAVNEFIAMQPFSQVWQMRTEQCVLVR